ncbi:hypothetical protein [Leptospira sp. GIMC2001]|uniref:hypothetical protein n=1 Tax=Leptospira sp. GIMC2001 TaxID=1513297 RepID=UPI00234BD699|nr:hypothetical protein [Leptospira sp. GIMC2001]WCL49032.1 hypothetical protein O4O04_17335 [Leptospira sp. GIMC2001]
MQLEKDLKERIQSGEIIHFSIQDIGSMNSIIEKLSINLSDVPIFSLLKTAIIEFVLNAFKASQKRRFFIDHGYSIINDYKAGLEAFRRAINDGKIKGNILDKNIKPVHMILKRENEFFKLTVSNAVTMTEEEFRIVQKIFLQGREISGIEDHLSGNNEAEGAGLGLLLIFSMLKNANLPPSYILFDTDRDETKFELLIPLACFTS